MGRAPVWGAGAVAVTAPGLDGVHVPRPWLAHPFGDSRGARAGARNAATHQTWYWRRAPDGPITQATFGTGTSVPLPADYDDDGSVDLAYWEPAERKIYVSFSRGASVDLVVPVPDRSIPAFVNME